MEEWHSFAQSITALWLVLTTPMYEKNGQAGLDGCYKYQDKFPVPGVEPGYGVYKLCRIADRD